MNYFYPITAVVPAVTGIGTMRILRHYECFAAGGLRIRSESTSERFPMLPAGRLSTRSTRGAGQRPKIAHFSMALPSMRVLRTDFIMQNVSMHIRLDRTSRMVIA